MKARKVTFLTTLSAAAILLVSMGEQTPKLFIWNASESVPVGLYRLRPIRKLAVTELVAVQPPEPLAKFLSEGGYLPRGIPMLKRVLALPGQTVCRNHLLISVDDIALGEALERDRRDRSLPVWQGCHVVAEGEVFLMNLQSADSLDGRYFGVTPATAILGRAEPLWTKEEE
ncbi:S26 family signal peptidase [Rhodopseudomonas palustris]|uniref:TraF peptidase. Serine peptidase. MEROPS family S26C n=1 Tax=Rhodopseudomonas palustris (strain BisB18) TaxID=316056 RepID=Q20ZK4_RHOPB